MLGLGLKYMHRYYAGWLESTIFGNTCHIFSSLSFTVKVKDSPVAHHQIPDQPDTLLSHAGVSLHSGSVFYWRANKAPGQYYISLTPVIHWLIHWLIDWFYLNMVKCRLLPSNRITKVLNSEMSKAINSSQYIVNDFLYLETYGYFPKTRKCK